MQASENRARIVDALTEDLRAESDRRLAGAIQAASVEERLLKLEAQVRVLMMDAASACAKDASGDH